MHNNNKYNARRIYYVRRGGGMDRDGGRRRGGGSRPKEEEEGWIALPETDRSMHTLARRVSLLGDSLELESVRVSWKIHFNFFKFC